jgi:hypothetical protein
VCMTVIKLPVGLLLLQNCRDFNCCYPLTTVFSAFSAPQYFNRMSDISSPSKVFETGEEDVVVRDNSK